MTTDIASFEVRTPDGVTLRASVEGKGRPLLLITGLSGTAAFWDEIAPWLARSFRVIRFDQRGAGESTRSVVPVTVDLLAQDCAAVLDVAGFERAVVLGHSLGGCIAQSFGRQAPDRTEALILSGTWLGQSRYLAGLFTARRAILDENPRAYAAISVLAAYPPAWIEANWHVYEAGIEAAPVSAQAKTVTRERIDALLSFDGSVDVGALTMPVMVLGTRDDRVVPPHLQDALATALPGSRRIALDSGGHLFPVSRPDAFTSTVVDWIGQLS